jgi:hypothetical protein
VGVYHIISNEKIGSRGVNARESAAGRARRSECLAREGECQRGWVVLDEGDLGFGGKYSCSRESFWASNHE